LKWKGKWNVYHGTRHFLVTRVGGELVHLACRLSDWMELKREVEDQDSVELDASPWMIPLSEAATKEPDDPEIADAFQLVQGADGPEWSRPGARFVLPWGPIYARTSRLAQEAARDSRDDRPARSGSSSSASLTGDGAGGSVPKLDMKPVINTSSVESRGTASESGNTNPVTGPAQRATLVVDTEAPGAFSSLAEACARAEDGSVIEVRCRGTLREGPIELGDRHLTIRAAPGYRPAIEFAVGQLELRNRQPRLFDIRHGSLALRDLDFRIVVDPTSADVWALVATRGADVSLDACTVTVESVAASPNTIVRFLASDVDDPMGMPPGEVSSPRPQLQLHNCLCLGSASLLRVQPAVRVRVELQNCAIEVQEILFAVLGGMERSVQGAIHELEVRHSTVKVGRGLAGYEASEPRAWLPRLEINALDNIFVGNPGNAWLSFKSPRPSDELRGLLHWKGQNNSYDSIELFWSIESMAGGGPELVPWDQWVKSPAREEIKAERGRVDFVASLDTAPPWQRSRAHFQPAPSGVASEMASDGGTRGADLNLIPPPPHERAAIVEN
jgi:hypothetical protein